MLGLLLEKLMMRIFDKEKSKGKRFTLFKNVVAGEVCCFGKNQITIRIMMIRGKKRC